MEKNSDLLYVFIAGAAAGLALGLMFAPGDGQETRKKINDMAKKIADSLLANAESFFKNDPETEKEY